MTTTYPPLPDLAPIDESAALNRAWVIATHHDLTVDLIMAGSAPFLGDLPRELTTGQPAPQPCSCRPAPHTFHFWSYSVVRRTSSRVQIDPSCPHHGKHPRR